MGIVDDLLASPGLYVGTDTGVGTDYVGAARIAVGVLPGRAGVSLDYEVLNNRGGEGGFGHVERTMIGKADDGGTIMVIAHTHGDAITILRETDPGVFEPAGPVPFPLKVVVSMTGPGRMRHAWWYGRPGEDAVERDVADVQLVTP